MTLRGSRVGTLLVAVTATVAALTCSAGGAAASTGPRADARALDETSPGSVKLAPPITTLSAASGCEAATAQYGACFDYAGGHASGANQGASVYFPVSSPRLGPHAFHTLVEMAVVSRGPAGGIKDTAEIGWQVTTPGGSTPHLFVYHFANGATTCYNGCGFVSTSATVKPGMVLASGHPAKWGIHHANGRWTFSYMGAPFGYIPDSAYGGTFGRAQEVSVYGEVGGPGTRPGCSQMGNGRFGTAPGSELLSGLTLFGSPVQPGLTRDGATDPAHWNTAPGNPGVRIGGPGNC